MKSSTLTRHLCCIVFQTCWTNDNECMLLDNKVYTVLHTIHMALRISVFNSIRRPKISHNISVCVPRRVCTIKRGLLSVFIGFNTYRASQLSPFEQLRRETRTPICSRTTNKYLYICTCVCSYHVRLSQLTWLCFGYFAISSGRLRKIRT